MLRYRMKQSLLHARIIIAVDRNRPLFKADVVDAVQNAVSRLQSALFVSHRELAALTS